VPGLEPRGAIWLDIQIPGQTGQTTIQVINTHLGLVPREQRLQAAALLGPAWVGEARRRGPLMVIGDFNAPTGSQVYRAFDARLRDSKILTQDSGRMLATFPSTFPVLRIDHAFVSEGLTVERVWVEDGPLARKASDHLPLIVDFHPGGPGSAA
jgi:endonuclease/exonuclease/phosphatase family metal-dependent hydrolase